MLSRRSLAAAAVAAVFARPALARPQVSTAIALAADVSSSMNHERFVLQRQGYAAAITDPRVIAAIEETAHASIGLCYFEWADDDCQRLLVPWTRVRTAADGERIAAVLARAPRPFDGSTNLMHAITFAADLFATLPFATGERVIDISGDGRPNFRDEEPDAARDRAVALGLRINGLTIADGYPTFPGDMTVTQYYEEHVVGGANAFVIEAESVETFAATLVAKLCRELA